MDYKQIIKRYLPLLQDLQMKASEHKGISVIIACDGWDLTAIVTRPVDNPQRPYETLHEHFHILYSEDELNQKYISLSAFFAEAITTTVTGVDCVISLN
jgi:hypothetical protein